MADGWRGVSGVESVDIRPPLAGRVFAIAFGVFWLSFPVRGIVSAITEGDGGFLAFLVPFTAFGVFVIGSNLRMRVRADANGLRFRNFWRQETYAASDIAAFMVHSPNGRSSGFGGMVAVVLHSGRIIDLRATSTGRFGSAKREVHLRRLQHWLESVTPRSNGPHPRSGTGHPGHQYQAPPHAPTPHAPFPAPPTSPLEPPASPIPPRWPDVDSPSFN